MLIVNDLECHLDEGGLAAAAGLINAEDTLALNSMASTRVSTK